MLFRIYLKGRVTVLGNRENFPSTGSPCRGVLRVSSPRAALSLGIWALWALWAPRRVEVCAESWWACWSPVRALSWASCSGGGCGFPDLPEILCPCSRRVASQRCSLEFLEDAMGCATVQRCAAHPALPDLDLHVLGMGKGTQEPTGHLPCTLQSQTHVRVPKTEGPEEDSLHQEHATVRHSE